MPRDYRPRSRRRRRRQATPGWVWLLTGLVLGILLAGGAYLWLQDDPQAPAVDGADGTADTKARDVRDVRREQRKPIPPPPPSRWTFFETLPRMEVVIPEQDIQGPAREGVRQVQRPGTYMLQAGSFRRREQAEQLRARLGLLGLHSSIQTVSGDGNRTWHRVRVGPYEDLDALNRARGLLKRHGIDAILIAVKTD